MEFYDEELTPLTSLTFEKKAPKIQWNRGLIREKYGDVFKNLAKCAALTICQELSCKKTFGMLSPFCVWNDYGNMDYANRELMKGSS